MDVGRMRDEITVISADGPTLDQATHGGKACGLQELMRLGLPVPSAIIVSMDCAAEIADGVEFGVVSSALAEMVDSVEALIEGWTGNGQRLAVRSGSSISLPGAFETVLDVLPDDVPEAIAAVAASARGLRAETIGRAMGVDTIPPTAVIVQRQIDATADEHSGAGAVTSCDPVTGAVGMRGFIGWQSRGDAVMAGKIAVEPAASIERRCPDVAEQLRRDCSQIEAAVGSPVELEFVIESGTLWYVQLRPLPDGRRPDGEDPARGSARPDHEEFRGRPASAGIATGELHVDIDDALDAIESGRPVIVALETSSPGDVPAMVGAAGVITVLGSPEGHTAVVTRGAGVPAVVSVQGLSIDADGINLGATRVLVGEKLTIDGTRGLVWRSEAP